MFALCSKWPAGGKEWLLNGADCRRILPITDLVGTGTRFGRSASGSSDECRERSLVRRHGGLSSGYPARSTKCSHDSCRSGRFHRSRAFRGRLGH